MRRVTQIIVHCSDTPRHMDIGVTEIRQWHLERGWDDVGYHYVIRRGGAIELGRELNTVGAHVRGHNEHSVGICLVGGPGDNTENNFSSIQFSSLHKLLAMLKLVYDGVEILGHRDLNPNKSCPCFDVRGYINREE